MPAIKGNWVNTFEAPTPTTHPGYTIGANFAQTGAMFDVNCTGPLLKIPPIICGLPNMDKGVNRLPVVQYAAEVSKIPSNIDVVAEAS